MSEDPARYGEPTKRDEFERRVRGLTVEAVEWRDPATFDAWYVEPGDMTIRALILSDGTRIDFYASAQIGVDAVEVDLGSLS